MSDETETTEPEAGTDVETTEAPLDPVAMLQAQNQGTITRLNQEGIGVDPTVFIGIAVDTILNLLMPPNTPLRHLYDVQYNLNLAQFLEEQSANARQAKLLEGVAGATPQGSGLPPGAVIDPRYT